MNANLNLKELVMYLIQVKKNLNEYDEYGHSKIIDIIENLLLVDKNNTLDYMKSIVDEEIMSIIIYSTFSSGVARFPSNKFIESCKKEMDRFKDSKNYPLMHMKYNEAIAFLDSCKNFKEERKMYMQRIKEEKKSK